MKNANPKIVQLISTGTKINIKLYQVFLSCLVQFFENSNGKILSFLASVACCICVFSLRDNKSHSTCKHLRDYSDCQSQRTVGLTNLLR